MNASELVGKVAETTHEIDMLSDLAVIMCVAAVTTVLFQRIRQPVVLGYLLAGLIVGPHLPIPLFADEAAGPPAVRAGRDPADVLAGPGVQPAQAGAGRAHRRGGRRSSSAA